MVQYKSGSERNNYWKLTPVEREDQFESKVLLRQMIDRIGGGRGHWTSATNVTRLRELVRRTDRGLRCYVGDSKSLLKKFCGQRRLPSNLQGANKEAMIKALEAADEEPKFERFLDLPPELRLLIYGLYCGSFPEYYADPDKPRRELEYPVSPPIAQTSSLIRRESLPCFFQGPSFIITHMYPFNGPLVPTLQPEALEWLSIMPQELLTSIRHLSMFLYRTSLGPTWMRLDMSAGQGEPTLQGFHEDDSDGLIPWDQQSEINC